MRTASVNHRLPRPPRGVVRALSFVSSLLLVAPGAVIAQTQQAAPVAEKKVLGVDDYARWRSLNGASISADGKWVTYDLAYTKDRKSVV